MHIVFIAIDKLYIQYFLRSLSTNVWAECYYNSYNRVFYKRPDNSRISYLFLVYAEQNIWAWR